MSKAKIYKFLAWFLVAGLLLLVVIGWMIVSAIAEEEQPSFIAKDSLVVISTNNLREDGSRKNFLLYAKAGGYYTAAMADRIVAIADYDDVAAKIVVLPPWENDMEVSYLFPVNLDQFIGRVDAGTEDFNLLSEMLDWLKNLPNGSLETENPLVTAVDGFWKESGVVYAIEESGWGNRLRDFLGTND